MSHDHDGGTNPNQRPRQPGPLAVILEDGANRHYLLSEENAREEQSGVGFYVDPSYREAAALHTLDEGANYWPLWAEADNPKRYYERYPLSFEVLQRRLGYRVRPSWIWQRKRYETTELILGTLNGGITGVRGVLGVHIETLDGKVRVGGNLDAGQPHAGKVRQASFILPKGLDGKEVAVRAEITTKGVVRPVRWACKEPLNADSSLTAKLVSFSDLRWRKGI